MAFKGDLIAKAGIYTNPGVIVDKKEDGTVVVDTEPMMVNKFHRYMNTTGLTLDEKSTFNGILDTIYKNEDDVVKLEQIQKNIDRLKVDPKNSKIVQYLRNQQAHLIRSVRELPRLYNWDEAKV